MNEGLKQKLDEQLASGRLSINEYQQKLEALCAADAMMGASIPRSVVRSDVADFPTSLPELLPLPPIQYTGTGFEASARRLRAWFRKTPGRWSFAMSIVPWIIRWPLAKLAEKRRAGLKYYYADQQEIEGPLSYEEIEACVLAGKISRDMLILREDSRNWLPLELSEFSFRFDVADRPSWPGIISHCSAFPQTVLGCLSPVIAVALLLLFVELTKMPSLKQTLDNRNAGAVWCVMIALLTACGIPAVWHAVKQVNRQGALQAKFWMLLALTAITTTALCLFALTGYFLFADLSQYGH